MMSPRIPTTVHGLNLFECLSGLQKCIRRGLECRAMRFACELGHTSKGFATAVGNRLEFICHEDIGLAAPEIIPLVRTCCQQAKEWYKPEDLGKWRTPIGTAIRAMCRAPKSREGDHFQAAIGIPCELVGEKPEIADWMYDKHTAKGRRMGRGLEHFRQEAAQLHPAPAEKDLYEDEAYQMWAWELKQHKKRPHAKSHQKTFFNGGKTQ